MSASFLAKKLVEAHLQVTKKSEHFEKLSASMGNERTGNWAGLDTSSTVVNGEVVSVYRVKTVKSTSIVLRSTFHGTTTNVRSSPVDGEYRIASRP